MVAGIFIGGAITGILLRRNLYWAAAWGAFLLAGLFVSLIYERGYKRGFFTYHNKIQEKIRFYIKEVELNQPREIRSGRKHGKNQKVEV